MIKKRDLKLEIGRLNEKLEIMEASMSAQMEGLAHINLAMEALQEKATKLNEKVMELGRIIEEDFLPDDSEYRKAKASMDAMLMGINSIMTYTGAPGDAGRDAK